MADHVRRREWTAGPLRPPGRERRHQARRCEPIHEIGLTSASWGVYSDWSPIDLITGARLAEVASTIRWNLSGLESLSGSMPCSR